jgi:hypothetical protein
MSHDENSFGGAMNRFRRRTNADEMDEVGGHFTVIHAFVFSDYL